MLAFDDLSLAGAGDPRLRLVIDMLTDTVYRPEQVQASLEAAGLKPGNYPLGTARMTWVAAVPDAAQRRRLRALIDSVVAESPAFGRELERRWQLLVSPGQGVWYRNDDPYACSFVGLRASRAVIDRQGLRNGLRKLAADEYRILLIRGEARSGKSHSWVLVDHLRNAGQLLGMHRFVRVTTHTWSGEVTGEDLALSLADKLGLDIKMTPSAELADARIRKLLDMIVGHYPQDDGVTRWIVLDGLDRPGVQDSARDVAKRLIGLVDEGELQQTRLIVTGLDPLGLTVGYAVRVEEIPSIDTALVRSFLAEVADHLGRDVTPGELDACAAEALGPGAPPRDLHEVEEAVVRLVKTRWAEGAGRAD